MNWQCGANKPRCPVQLATDSDSCPRPTLLAEVDAITDVSVRTIPEHLQSLVTMRAVGKAQCSGICAAFDDDDDEKT